MTLLGSVMFLIVAFAAIFFGARGCIATQEATQIRKYVTNSSSLLSESANIGNEELQSVLQNAGGDPAQVDAEALARLENHSRNLYGQALTNEEVPPEFEEVHHYLVTSLGIRADAIGQLADAGGGEPETFSEVFSAAVEDFRLSDGIIGEHYLTASRTALEEAGRLSSDGNFLYEVEPFMDYEELGFEAAGPAGGAIASDPNALHSVELVTVEVAGQSLYPGGDVTLTGPDELIFAATVYNSGEMAETSVPVEVILNKADRQARTATIERIEPGSSATVEVSGFRPGELYETAEVTVEAGPVEYEEFLDDNTLKGTVTFGL